MGKSIQSQTIWVNGQLEEANYLVSSIAFDDLHSTATFYWCLYNTTSSENVKLIEGNLPIYGVDYENWSSDPDINENAYQYIAQQLNLVLE
jgi:hypothetical protein